MVWLGFFKFFFKSPFGETAETSLSVGKMTLKNRSLAVAEEYASQRACRNKPTTNETELKSREDDKGRLTYTRKHMDTVTSVHCRWGSAKFLNDRICHHPAPPGHYLRAWLLDAVVLGQGQ